MPLKTVELLVALQCARTSHVSKPWGIEQVLDLGPESDMLIKIITVGEGQMTSMQYHEKKDEVLYILDGSGYIEFGESPGDPDHLKFHFGCDPVRVPPGQVHRSYGYLQMLEISTRYPDDVIRLKDNYGR